MKSLKYLSILVVMFLMSTVNVFAQNPGDFDDPADPNPTDAPISGYIWVVALVGLVYVFYKLKSKQLKSA
ncbi:hypothetical protein GV828_04345 [Flavobacterium sp. NST-5]|uniref:Signal peptidase n=1 Tax=Flavobacterium ichthyis TaxID=2698827 RepID=A0ABW9Z6E7_9FLAO|nr:hypothetical protein [Flavobacterium ichthyis]NBL64428.1 hypothetical protein [Flavobacterium ichthyis]